MNFRVLFPILFICFNFHQNAAAQATFMTTHQFILRAEAAERTEKSSRGETDKQDLEKLRELTFFVQGVADGLAVSSDVCVPVGVSSKQIVAMTKKLAIKIPEAWNQPAAVFIRLALLDQWKCQKNGS